MELVEACNASFVVANSKARCAGSEERTRGTADDARTRMVVARMVVAADDGSSQTSRRHESREVARGSLTIGHETVDQKRTRAAA